MLTVNLGEGNKGVNYNVTVTSMEIWSYFQIKSWKRRK